MPESKAGANGRSGPTDLVRQCGNCAHWRRNSGADAGDSGACTKLDTTKDRDQVCFKWARG